MNKSKVFIVKQKWDEMSHFAKVKALFFSEEKAHTYIDEQNKLPKNKGSWLIISDRHIRDYEPCMTENEIEIMKLEAVQHFIDHLISNGKYTYPYLEEKWGANEQRRIELEETKELKP